MDIKNGSSPFLDLLKPENLSKINIDEELIPIFKVVINKINDYFSKNGLLDMKNWKIILEDYLLENNRDKHAIVSEDIDNSKAKSTHCRAGYYDWHLKRIVVDSKHINDQAIYRILCHEFLHFLVTNSRSIDLQVNDIKVLDEGLTELLTTEIMGVEKRVYLKEISMAELYCSLKGVSKPSLELFSGDKIFENEKASVNLMHASDSYISSGTELNRVQEFIINNLLDYHKIDSFDKLLDIVQILSKRPVYDYNYMVECYKKMVDAYLENTGMVVTPFLKQRLIDLCKISDKAFLYGKEEVADFVFDDLHIAFDKYGKIYYDEYPLDGETKKGQIYRVFSADHTINSIEVTHRDKVYKADHLEAKFTNWQEAYKNYLVYVKRLISEQERRGKSR